MDSDINSTAWWDDYFRDQGEKNLGGEQTEYFMHLILDKLPICLKKILSEDWIKILNWGCALGQGVDLLSKSFPKAKVYGLDASIIAIEKAKNLYPNYNFSTSLLEEQNEKYDVIISSNCLEHFSNPQAVMQEHLKYTSLLYIILVPFNKLNRIESHLVTFNIDSFPNKANDFSKIYSKIIDVDNSNFSEGSQILVVYAHKDLNVFNLYLQNLVPDALSNDLILDSGMDSQTPALWDKVSELYKDDPSDSELVLGDEIEALLLKMGISHGASLLEVGCGSSHLSGILAKKGYNTTLLDFSEAALEKAKKYYKRQGLKGNFILCDMMKLSPDLVGHYDVVWNLGVLEHFDSWQVIRVMKKMGNIAKELVIVLVPNARSKPYLLFRRAAIRAGEWQWGRELLRDTMIHLAESAGLNVIEETYLGERFSQDHLEYYKSKLNASNTGVNDGLIFCHEFMPKDQRYLIALIAKGQVKSGFAKAKVLEFMIQKEDKVNRRTYSFDNNELANALCSNKEEIDAMQAEISALQAKIQQMESSISWKMGQFYGKYFDSDSILTKSLSHILNKYKSPDEKEKNKLYINKLLAILEEHKGKVKGIIVYPPTVDWNIPLFQRPQQLALRLSDLGYLFFYCTFNLYDKVEDFQEINKNCYLAINYDLLLKELPSFILFVSSTILSLDIRYITKRSNKRLLIYEYIDEIHPDLSGQDTEGQQKMLDRHKYMIKKSDLLIATADNLFEELQEARRDSVYLMPNGVDYTHFHIKRDSLSIPKEMKTIVDKGSPIIGYYGALAKWYDYDLLKFIAAERQDYQIVLIGWDFDGSIKLSGLQEFDNIHFLGPKKYDHLPTYAIWFDVAIIPFVLNKITESTSPIKIFEYMALGKPIVTTDMRECRKYKSVLIGKDYADFINKLDLALKLKNDTEYLALLDKEAKMNTWDVRAKLIDELISKNGAAKSLPY